MKGSLIAFIYPLVFHKVVLWGRYCSQCTLKLNSWLLGRHQPGRVSIGELSVGDSEVVPVSTAKKLGAWMDSHLKLDTPKHEVQPIITFITFKGSESTSHTNLHKTWFMQCYLDGLTPYIMNLVSVKKFPYHSRSHDELLLTQPSFKSKTQGDRTFSMATPTS